MNVTNKPQDAFRALKELVRRIECGEYRITSFAVRKTGERESYAVSDPVGSMSVSEGSIQPTITCNVREGIGFEVSVMETYDARDGRPAPRGNIFDPPSSEYNSDFNQYGQRYDGTRMPFNVADELARDRVARAQRESAARVEAEAKRQYAKLMRASEKAKKAEAEAAKKGKPFGARDLDID